MRVFYILNSLCTQPATSGTGGGTTDNHEATTYTVKFDANGGTGTMTDVWLGSALCPLPTEPTGITAT